MKGEDVSSASMALWNSKVLSAFKAGDIENMYTFSATSWTSKSKLSIAFVK